MNAVVVVSRAKQWQDTSPLVILLYTLQGEISLVPLSMLEFVLWLFIHNCTTSMLSFTLEEEKEKQSQGKKAISELAKKPVGITVLPSLSASGSVFIYFFQSYFQTKKLKSLHKHWADRCIFIQFYSNCPSESFR